MASFFISHSSRDNSVAADVRAWLEGQGFTSTFLDFDPEAGIPPGRHWENELYSQLRKADVVSSWPPLRRSIRSGAMRNWCWRGRLVGRSCRCSSSRRRNIRSSAIRSGFRFTTMAPNLSGRWLALQRLEIDALDTLEWNTRLSPYPGLEAFDEDRAGVFYGRDREIQTVLEPLRRAYAEGSERLVLVAGASGSGKSSLVRAGVVPRLRRLEAGWIVVPMFTPQDAPLEKLARSLSTESRARGHDLSWEACRQRLEDGGSGLKSLARDLLGSTERGSVVVSIDQAEELVTQCSAGERLALLDLLAAALAGNGPLRSWPPFARST